MQNKQRQPQNWRASRKFGAFQTTENQPNLYPFLFNRIIIAHGIMKLQAEKLQ